jgi:hypothetical protein
VLPFPRFLRTYETQSATLFFLTISLANCRGTPFYAFFPSLPPKQYGQTTPSPTCAQVQLTTTSQMSVRLPNELLGVVVDCLQDAFDWTTIQTMSLVSPDLRHTCQRLLCVYLSITLVIDGTTTTADRLEGLAKTPRLTSYVRSFRLALPDSPQGDREEWISKHGAVLVQVLQAIPLGQLEALCLANWQDIYLGGPWESPQLKEVRKRLGQALKMLLQAPSIVSLSTTHHPIERFQECGSSLKHVVVSGTEGQDFEEVGLRSHALAPKIILESLESHDNSCNVSRYMPQCVSIHQYLLHPSSPFSLRSLKRLVWKNGSDHGLEELQLVMQSCNRSLQYLSLHVGKSPARHVLDSLSYSVNRSWDTQRRYLESSRPAYRTYMGSGSTEGPRNSRLYPFVGYRCSAMASSGTRSPRDALRATLHYFNHAFRDGIQRMGKIREATGG